MNLLGKKIKRTKKEKKEKQTNPKDLEMKEIKRKMDVEKEKERRKEVQRKQHNSQEEMICPNNTLFVENLTPSVSELILKNLFSQYNGFKYIEK